MSTDTLDPDEPSEQHDFTDSTSDDPAPTENDDDIGDADRMLDDEQLTASDRPQPPDDEQHSPNDDPLPYNENEPGDADLMLDDEQEFDSLNNNKTDGIETDHETHPDETRTQPPQNEKSYPDSDDLSEPPIDLGDKTPPDDKSPSHDGDGIGDADRMFDNEQPLEELPDETNNNVNWQPTPEPSTEGNSEAESEGDTYHDAGDLQRPATAEASPPNNHVPANPDHTLNEEQQQRPGNNNDSTIGSSPQQKTPETLNENNGNSKASTESRNNPDSQISDPLSAGDDDATRNWEDTDRVDQDSELDHVDDQQPNKQIPDKQPTENVATGTIRAGADFPLIKVGQLNENTAPVDTNQEDNEFISAAQQHAANSHQHSGDLPARPNIMNDAHQGLWLPPAHGLNLQSSREHGIGISRPDQGSSDVPPGYEIAPQATPEFPRLGHPTAIEKPPTYGTSSTDNANPDNGGQIPDKNLPSGNSPHNTDGNPTPRLASASSTEASNDSNSGEHVPPADTGNDNGSKDASSTVTNDVERSENPRGATQQTPDHHIREADCASEIPWSGAKYIEDVDPSDARIYDHIRSNSGDTARIAENTGIPQSKLDQIKDHLFHREHDLPTSTGQIRRGNFSPDSDIANLWPKAEVGQLTREEMQQFHRLMAHEYVESSLMKKGMPYRSSDPSALDPVQGNRPTPEHYGAHDLAPLANYKRNPFAHWESSLGRAHPGITKIAPDLSNLEVIIHKILSGDK